jgi:hypothetical protein
VSSQITNDITIIGSGITGTILATLLQQTNRIAIGILGDCKEGDGFENSDIQLYGQIYNIVVSYLHDVDGMVKYVLHKLQIQIDDLIKDFEVIECVPVEAGKILYRDRLFSKFETDLISFFPDESTKIADFFRVCLGINEESMKSLTDEKFGTKDIPLFLKYYRTTYKDFLRNYQFSDKLENVLMSFAPWEDISLIAMSTYWSQISSIAITKDGFKQIYSRLLTKFITQGGRYLAYIPICNIKNNGDYYSIELEDGTLIQSKVLAFTKSRAILNEYNLGVYELHKPNTRYPSNIFFLKLNGRLNFTQTPAYLRYRFLSGESYHRLNFSYLENNIVKVEFLGELPIDYNYLYHSITKCLSDIGYEAGFEVVGIFSNQQVFAMTGIADGVLYCWAHSTEEIIKNPLGKLAVKPGIYCMGDWGTGYFYAGEIYAREINKFLKLSERVKP